MATTTLRWAGLALMVASTGCMAHHATHAAAPAPSGEAAAASGMPAGACPMEVPGTQLSAVDTQGGEAVTFTTTPDHEAELRGRVHAMADMHNRHHEGGGMHRGGGMHEGMHGTGPMGGSTGSGSMDHQLMMPPPSRASVEDVPGGARLVVTAEDPADLQRLQAIVRMHADRMSQTHACGMGEPQRGGR